MISSKFTIMISASNYLQAPSEVTVEVDSPAATKRSPEVRGRLVVTNTFESRHRL